MNLVSVDDCEVAKASLLGFQKVVIETTAAVEALSAALDKASKKLADLGKKEHECVVRFVTPKGRPL